MIISNKDIILLKKLYDSNKSISAFQLAKELSGQKENYTLTKISIGMKKHLDKLARYGLLKLSSINKHSYYSINEKNVYFPNKTIIKVDDKVINLGLTCFLKQGKECFFKMLT